MVSNVEEPANDDGNSKVLARDRIQTRWSKGMKNAVWTVGHHLKNHTGVGLICAVAYFDPGNWSVDLQAGSEFGYKLLFVVLLSALFAAFLQTLATRLGCVTGLNLAQHTRILLHTPFPTSSSNTPAINRRNRHRTLLVRWAILYPLYVLSEVAIIATDLAELLGSGIALSLLFPRLPLWGALLVTAADVMFILALGDPVRSEGGPLKFFEALIGVLVFAVLICVAVILGSVDVNWGTAFDGFLPSKTLGQSDAFYTAIGVIGATVMPHGLFLGSALATQDRVGDSQSKWGYSETTIDMAATTPNPSSSSLSLDRTFVASQTGNRSRSFSVPCSTTYASSNCNILTAALSSLYSSFKSGIKRFYRTAFSARKVDAGGYPLPQSLKQWENRSHAFVRAHLGYGMVDIIVSLLGFAVVINALILILSGAVFYYGSGDNGSANAASSASLQDAYTLIRDAIGKGPAILFALALLCAGQSASLTATLAGQVVAEGFIRWRISPFLRRLLTRLIGFIPSLIIAAVVGPAGVNAALVASQVCLSIVLPFVVLPLVYLTSSKAVMRVRVGDARNGHQPSGERTLSAGGCKEKGADKGRGDEETTTTTMRVAVVSTPSLSGPSRSMPRNRRGTFSASPIASPMATMSTLSLRDPRDFRGSWQPQEVGLHSVITTSPRKPPLPLTTQGQDVELCDGSSARDPAGATNDINEVESGRVPNQEEGHSRSRAADGEGEGEGEWIDYSNGWFVAGLGYLIWLVILVANAYLIVTLALGED